MAAEPRRTFADIIAGRAPAYRIYEDAAHLAERILGFFRQHGIHRFIGRHEYVNPTFVDPVWGVGDYDVLMRANEEFRAMAEKGPFFGAIGDQFTRA